MEKSKVTEVRRIEVGRHIAVIATMLMVLNSRLPAQPSPKTSTTTQMFPFVLPWSDSLLGTATDVSFLNAKPAGTNGPIISQGGHFVEARTGKQIRFLGTNFAARAAFPSHADADKVAARIAKLGINIVRMHHMDNIDWGQSASIWDYTYKDRQHISPAQLDKLDYLVGQLKKHGVYVNLNLHVSRQFSAADGFPASVADIKFGYDKRVDEFDARMIALQKQYAHDLLSHVNPYTGLSYAADPAIAMVEINNENSLVGDPWATYGADLNTLPEPFHKELTGLWNEWLVRKYRTNANLLSAWTAGVTPTGPGLLNSTTQWSNEHQGDTNAAMWMDTPDLQHPGAVGARVEIKKVDSTDWHVQSHVVGLDLVEGAAYTITFRARADGPRDMPVNCGLDQADWHNLGLSADAKLSREWARFHYTFTANNVVPKHARIAFVLGGATGTVWIDDLQIHAGVEGAALRADESLANKNIMLPDSTLKAQHDDWIDFLADTERGYAEEMRRYIKDELKSGACVICSQVSWGGLTGIRRESNMDFADNHAYWQHPVFPHKPWDPDDWFIENTPMVTALANGQQTTLAGLAEFRVEDKPYTVSEYNHPAPNEYREETLPLLATFAALQDWDAIYLFDYGDYGTGIQNDQVNGYFGISSDPAKTAFLPAAALIFRTREVQASPRWPLTVQQSAVTHPGAALWPPLSNASLLALAIGVRTTTDKSARTGTLAAPTRTAHKANARVELRSGKALFTSSTPFALCMVGYVGGTQVDLEGCSLTFPEFGNDFAAATLTPLDSKPLQSSRRMLLTLVGKIENQGMVWNAQRTSVGSRWGHGPTLAEGIAAEVVLPGVGARHVWALDGTGKRTTAVATRTSNQHITFTTGPQYKTLWYEIVGADN